MRNLSGIKLIIVVAAIAVALVLSFNTLKDNLNLGLDLQGGTEVILQGINDDGSAVTDQDMEKLVTVMRERVDAFGVSEPIIQREGSDRLIIQLAGVDDPDKAIEQLGRTAKLEFRGPDGTVILTGADLEEATYQYNASEPTNQQHQIALEFTSEGTKKFYEATAKYLGQIISIYLDDKEISSPTVNSVIPDGEAIISGGYTTADEAAADAQIINGGALPVNVEILSKSIVGPTLGQDSLSSSMKASIIGLIILAFWLIALYRMPGVWGCVSLVVYGLILMWVLNLINATLTLTSIAGFILSIGVAIDANIIIYERIKEEMYTGKSVKASIEAGFKRAFWTIFDSNLTTLIAAIVLYYFGSGTIKGFALTLSIGLIASMFTAITFTRFMLRNMADVDCFRDKKFYGVTEEGN